MGLPWRNERGRIVQLLVQLADDALLVGQISAQVDEGCSPSSLRSSLSSD